MKLDSIVGRTALAGAAALGVLAGSASAADRNIPHNIPNIPSFPSIYSQTPYRIVRINEEAIPRTIAGRKAGIPAILYWYKAGGAHVGLYTVDNCVYSVSVDRDGKKPLDEAYVDMRGDGVFSPIPTSSTEVIPGWVYQKC